MANNSYEKPRLVRSLIVALLPMAIGLFGIALVLAQITRFTIASDEKSDDLGYYPYGYKVEQYYAHNSYRLTFWTSRGMDFVYQGGQVTVDEVVEQRWLKNDAAIYLNLRITHHDSIVSTDSARIIYDFHRGQMYVSSPFTLWRMFDKRHESTGWMTDSEFDAVLSQLEK